MTNQAEGQQQWRLELHPSGRNKMIISPQGEHYYFPPGPETVTDAIVGKLNSLTAELAIRRMKEAYEGNPQLSHTSRELLLMAQVADLQQRLEAAEDRARKAEAKTACPACLALHHLHVTTEGEEARGSVNPDDVR